MKIRNKIISVVLAAPLMVGTAVAMDAAELLGTLDADGNGSISQEEAAANEDLMGKWDSDLYNQILINRLPIDY